jgi:translation initiation factor 2 subunit 1
MPQRADFPDIGNLVVCSVTNVKNFGAFVTLDEYGGKEGFIHVRDVATGWVKYIRDHVREGQKIVCKVLGVDEEKGHIDLSLKQVNDHARREKIQEWKNEKKADKLLEIVGAKLGKNVDEAFAEVGEKLIQEYGSLFTAFEQARTDPEPLKELGLDKKWIAAITDVAKENIELPSVSIDGTLEIMCPAQDGIDHIKKALVAGLDSDEVEIKIHYVGAPKYKVSVTAQDYKIAEQELKDSIHRMTTAIQKAGGSASFKRKDEK